MRHLLSAANEASLRSQWNNKVPAKVRGVTPGACGKGAGGPLQA